MPVDDAGGTPDWNVRIIFMDDIEMIERLARAICKQKGIAPDHHHPEFGTQWQATAREAKGLLIVMLDPTDAMIRAGARRAEIDPERARTAYRAMIDAAIARHI
ncbi:hypothetical protein [Sphingobium sp. Sx8-8]|uniref:hypothetical protein n=1 Tax=Sphingobium sp. Sx8-8 TaxID=2933617 RepID=UPI001F5A5FC8|nr:hypothetical protein [Sphingobium sp. Sx8-8]